MAKLTEQKFPMATVTYFSLVEQEILIHLMNLGIIFRGKKRNEKQIKQWRRRGTNGMMKKRKL